MKKSFRFHMTPEEARVLRTILGGSSRSDVVKCIQQFHTKRKVTEKEQEKANCVVYGLFVRLDDRLPR